jgi:pilus assembly protein Flp/PilA
VEYPVKTTLLTFLADESGVTAIEYGLIAALISVVIIGAVSNLGTHIRSTFSSVAASL